MRWSYLLPRLSFVVLIWAFFYFAFDPILKWGIIKAGEKTFEAKVEISKLGTSFFPPKFEIDGFKAGNSQAEFENLFEFKKLKFEINGKQLLEKKIIVKEGSVSGLSFSTPRKTSCKIKIDKTPPPKFISEYTQKAKDFSYDKLGEAKSDLSASLNADYQDLESVKLAKELSDKYETEYSKIIKEADFSKYQDRIDAISSRYDKLKSEKNFLKQAKEAGKLKKEADALFKDFNEDKKNISAMTKDAAEAYSKIKEAKERDSKKLMAMAKLPNIDKEKIAEYLLGKGTYSKVEKLFSYSMKASKYIPDNPKKKIFSEKTKRGRTVHFLKEENYPRFLLEKAHIDGVLTPENPIQYSGSVFNLTNQPSMHRKPLMLEVKGSKDTASIYLNSKAFLYETPFKTETELKYEKVKIANLSFGEGKSFNIAVEKAYSDNYLTLKSSSSLIDAKFNSRFSDVKFAPDFSNVSYKPLRESLEKSFAEVKTFSLDVTVSGDFKNPAVKMRTDLAEILNSAFKRSLSDQLNKAQEQIKEKLDSVLKEHTLKLDEIVNAKKQELNSKLKANQSKMDDWKKDLENKLKNQLPKF